MSTPAATVQRELLADVLVVKLGKSTAAEVLSALDLVAEAVELPEPGLMWESAGTDEPGDQNATSTLRVDPDATSAYYSLGPAYTAPSKDGERWSLELIQVRDGEHIQIIDLGRHPSETAAKDHALAWEAQGIVECTWQTTVEHWARIPLSKLIAAAREESDPDHYITDDGSLRPDARTGIAMGAFSDLLGIYEPTSEKQVVGCVWDGGDE